MLTELKLERCQLHGLCESAAWLTVKQNGTDPQIKIGPPLMNLSRCIGMKCLCSLT